MSQRLGLLNELSGQRFPQTDFLLAGAETVGVVPVQAIASFPHSSALAMHNKSSFAEAHTRAATKMQCSPQH